MATKTKKTVKKVAKKVVAKKTIKVVKATPRKAKAVAFKSFQLVKEKTPFMTYQVSQQTIYWAILFIYIMILSLWILNIQLDTLRIIDKINAL
ncbi:hypothetical protein COV88_01000 [Candidatus Saccharibacteria bacterium CG11_big_fil_rev_8_21_14_0_20_41_19]|nr:hypothetical protein [Candidatus Saccharibacteria bacterium]OIP86237.1 MAG: hypothetical protein AUK57_00475 [Candidatus Saccharibacteria bacterium CG2_30_41_52]PIQ71050.1 MAG: hypothetical protein COV88_01000 [Candidatus Saccharibacteria bacterium CG11_big_fil_rev_8_21_14_0_20_41_19]PIZ59415.1 MAG: hypothetical protein COY18_03450 [Candidatus Saccharibacteria bacterium CG_4_10_14_0_2_um_filter_41_11]PJC29469.1 MAG: hypothetical protein CO052_03000 [Candidatus Saccharibacteria bacterium CG_4